MTHRSRYTVLPHEDRNEFNALLSLLTQEHQPQGMSETHLVEELAGIMWRKQRVLQAESAKINAGLKSALFGSNVHSTSMPFHAGLSSEHFDIAELSRMTPDEVEEFYRHRRTNWQILVRSRNCLIATAPVTTKPERIYVRKIVNGGIRPT